MNDYQQFLESKRLTVTAVGFETEDLHPALFPFQHAVVRWAVRKGRAAIFAGTGTGKTLMSLAYAQALINHNKVNRVLILAPLAVARQTSEQESVKWGVDVKYVHNRDEMGESGIYITNYERLDKFLPTDCEAFILDESSRLKEITGKQRNQIVDFANARDEEGNPLINFRLACTATPAPNDLLEIGNHAEFLGVMTSAQMTACYFVHEAGVFNGVQGSHWRLKGHASRDFYQWLSSWAVALLRPSDIGFTDEGYILPELHSEITTVESDYIPEGQLFMAKAISATESSRIRKATIEQRIALIAERVNASDEQFLIWTGLNEEGKALQKLIPGSVDVHGSMTEEKKSDHLLAFAKGELRILITKSSIAGFGINLQNAHNMVFCGIDFSWERYYQAIRRMWRFGQKEVVNVWIVTSNEEKTVYEVLLSKEKEAMQMTQNLIDSSREFMESELTGQSREDVYREDSVSGNGWGLMLGDSCLRMTEIPSDSVHISVYSPPFSDMYIYNNSPADLSNSRDTTEFMEHYRYIIRENLRITIPGRICAVHVQDPKVFKHTYGFRGLLDFPGDVIRAYQTEGWIFRSRITIDKNPQIVATRNKDTDLLFVTGKRDSADLAPMATDYLLIFKKPGENPVPVTPYANGEMSENDWITWAHAIWYSIRETDVLNVALAKDDADEKHMCLATGTLVLTYDGYKAIESIEPGELVLTHKGRWRAVTAKKNMGVRDSIRVTAQGVPDLKVTPDHRLWTRTAKTKDARLSAMKTEPDWIDADQTLGSYVYLPLPPIEESDLTEDEWWIVGRWMGDGHLSVRGLPHISCAFDEIDELVAKLGSRTGHISKSRTCAQVYIKGRDGQQGDKLHKMIERCGKGASSKVVPGEALALEPSKAQSLLEGYLSADGHYVTRYDRWTASSISRSLVMGMAMIAQRALGVTASVYAGRSAGEYVIEGRTVNTKQDWILSIPPRNISAFADEDGTWKKVRSLTDIGEHVVWDIQVEEDESFIAEGCAVHNCPLQLPLIERVLKPWSNPGELVFTPFAGIGSEVYQAVKFNRRGLGIELKESYWKQAIKNCRNAENQTGDLFAWALQNQSI